ncbi:MAG: GC-type dockerin domain-anchored protein, partial [Planctomycetota bacterium]
EGQAIDISAVPGVPAVHVVDEITRSLGFNDRGEVAITVRFVGSANQQVIVVFDMPRLPECPADINLDASLNIDDFSAFVDGFFSALPRTDIDDNGTLGIDDFSAFVMAFFAGC